MSFLTVIQLLRSTKMNSKLISEDDNEFEMIVLKEINEKS